MPNWDDLFRLHAPIAEIFLRGSLTFLGVFALMRVVGRRESGGLSINDLLVVVLVAQSMSAGLSGRRGGLLDGLLLVATILFWSVILDALAYRFPKIRALLKSSPSALIVDGELNRRAMRRELMEEDELRYQLRLHGIERLEEVSRAYIEPNGMISVLRRDAGPNEPPAKPPAS